MAVNEFDEFRKQYERTFIRVKFEGSKHLQVVNVRSCNDDDKKNPYIVLHNPMIGQTTVMWHESKQELDYEFPVPGLFNFDNSFLAFYKFPDRQWKRGISSGNIRIIDPLYQFKRLVPQYFNYIEPKGNLDFHTLTAAFSKTYPSNINEAVNLVLTNSSVLGIALSPVFAITKSPTLTSLLVLWKHLNMIGRVDAEKHTVEVVEPVFFQEVIDYIKRTGDTTWQVK